MREIDDVITLQISRKAAEKLSFGLSDLLCWCSGFTAALGDDTSRSPMGVEAARDMNIALKRALDEAEEAQKS